LDKFAIEAILKIFHLHIYYFRQIFQSFRHLAVVWITRVVALGRTFGTSTSESTVVAVPFPKAIVFFFVGYYLIT